VVSEAGPGTAWHIGDRVMVVVVPIEPHGGAYADQLVVSAESVAAIPDGIDFPEAATLPMNGLTARAGLDMLDLAPGATVAVTGAAGAVGGYAIQLAKADGLHIIADASADDEELVRHLGADQVVRRGHDVAERIRALAPGGVDGVFDAAVLDGAIVPAVRDGGAMAVVRFWDGDPGQNIRVEKVFANDHVRDTAALDKLARQAADGLLTLRVARVMPASQAAEAHRLLEAGGLRGRIVLDFTA
jgi:NADPH:quinone reductase-like Zn-dependent oxidoreductase